MTLDRIARREVERRTANRTGYGGGPATPQNISYEGQYTPPSYQPGGENYTIPPYEPGGSLNGWWSQASVDAYGGQLDPRFDASDTSNWNQATIDRILSNLQVNLGTVLSQDVPDSVQYLQYVYAAEEALRAAGVNGNQVAGLINETKNTLTNFAGTRQMILEDFNSSFLEDNDPANRLKIDDHQLVPPHLAINIGGQSPKKREEEYLASIPKIPGPKRPAYVRPDRDLVRDGVKSRLQVLTGNVDEGNLEALTDMFMTTHRADYDNPTQDIDPLQKITEAIRKQSDYGRIHKYRPEDVDESEWLTTAIAAARGTGLREDVARVRGQAIASVGTTQSTNQGFATQRSGQLDTNFFSQVQAATTNLGRAFR